MKSKIVYIVIIIAFILIGLAYGWIYSFYGEYNKKMTELDDKNQAVSGKVEEIKTRVNNLKDALETSNDRLRAYSDTVSALENKVKLSVSDLEGVKQMLGACQTDLSQLRDKVENASSSVKEVNLGNLAVNKDPAVPSTDAVMPKPQE